MTERHIGGTVPVWDRFVRIFHWSLVGLIAIAWLSEDGPRWLHENAGYTVAGLLAARILWGFVGSPHARFSDFVRSPAAVLGYLRDLLQGRDARFLGHNPAGGAMILALIETVAATAATGWLLTKDRFSGSGMIEEAHETCATLILLLASAHVAGVVLESLRHRENLVSAMITGHKRPLDEVPR